MRHDIAQEHGIPCPAINFEDTDEGIAAAGSKEELDRAARDYLLQKNVVRRHYTQGQRAAIAAQLATMPQGARTDLEPSAALRKVSQPEAATLCGVSVRSVQHAERIFREGTADEIRDMWAGAPLEPIVHAIAEREKKRKRRSLTVVSSSPEPRPSVSLLRGDLLHVLPTGLQSGWYPTSERAFHQAARRLQFAVPAEAHIWCKSIQAIKEGSTYQEILSYAEENDIDLICMGAHGTGRRL